MGMQTDLYTLTNDNGMEVCFTNFGGRIVSILVPDRHGNMLDVCLGHDSIADYIRYGHQGCNFGALIGRYGNRIRLNFLEHCRKLLERTAKTLDNLTEALACAVSVKNHHKTVCHFC